MTSISPKRVYEQRRMGLKQNYRSLRIDKKNRRERAYWFDDWVIIGLCFFIGFKLRIR